MTEYKLNPAKKVAVIGGGPCGVAVIRPLVEENAFDEIVVFEKRDRTGGLWNYANEEFYSQKHKVPSVDPAALVKPHKIENQPDNYWWPTATYELLDANVTKEMIGYKELKMNDDIPIFPTKNQILDYFQEYAKPLEKYIKFGRNVVSIRQLDNLKWEVTTRDVNDNTQGGLVESKESPDHVDLFDAVIVSSGSYDSPYIPDKNGLSAWNEKYPDSISHSKQYRHPRQFKDVKGEIIVVGNSASGSDISYQLATDLNRRVYKSARSESLSPVHDSSDLIVVPDIEKLDPETKTVYFVDGTVVENVDRILFATGFLRHYPFLKEINESDKPIITDGARVHGTYRQLIAYNYPGLAFTFLARHTLPVRLAQTQGAWLARVFSGRLKLPTVEEMQKEEQDRLAVTGEGPDFHTLLYPADVIYYKAFNKDIWGCGNEGYFPVEWDREDIKKRAGMLSLKENYVKYTTLNGKIPESLEQLKEAFGFEYPEVDYSIFDL
ncbi:unnamed protein product [[Candida] boidinii]|uniref:Unnamed protein product n=1 Tax=Candida boidinii TaxID=5477 RepID=A0A9W6SUA1_CANBO|nr:oxidoreductase activity protein [[Candida] boidinii]OWB85044.1 oxidoreductase activity protein [[Candida] boidinii]GME66840.1 unnamed protein product [[Candida] boidinii]GMG10545.1 unnamed protein product [[Candida] boidinii]